MYKKTMPWTTLISILCIWNKSNHFKYIVSTVDGNNLIEEEIKERIILGNKAYYANQALFKRKCCPRKLS
jgi:hypothetical protein